MSSDLFPFRDVFQESFEQRKKKEERGLGLAGLSAAAPEVQQ